MAKMIKRKQSRRLDKHTHAFPPKTSYHQIQWIPKVSYFYVLANTPLLSPLLTAPNISPSTSNASTVCFQQIGLDKCYITASDEIRLFCFILEYSEDSFSVKIGTDKMVEDLRDEIVRKAKLTNKILPGQLKLFKVNYQSSVDRLILISLEATSTRHCC